jgi:hypothetical protein
MDGNMSIDLTEARKTFDHAEVISLFFPLLSRSLVMDLRRSPHDSPYVAIMPIVASPEERIRVLEQLRPHLPRPERVVLVPWTRSVQSLQSMGLWGLVCERLACTGCADALRNCQRHFQELVRLEREAMRRIIRGKGCETIWQRQPQ